MIIKSQVLLRIVRTLTLARPATTAERQFILHLDNAWPKKIMTTLALMQLSVSRVHVCRVNATALHKVTRKLPLQ